MNGTDVKTGDICVLDWLEKQESENGEKIAVRCVDEEISYKMLAKNARMIGSAIMVEERRCIVLYMEKSIACYVAMLGVLFAGDFYSVIDTDIPAQRVEYICNVAKVEMVIADKANIERARKIFTGSSIQVSCYEELLGNIDHELLELRRKRICDTDPMYCNFTSGSTGNPKGVLISHRSVIDFIPVFCSTLGLCKEERFANQAPFDFDVSVKDMYGSLYLGADVSLIPREYFVNPVMLMDYLSDNNITTLVWAVSAMLFVSGMKGFKYRIPSQIKKIIFSGEIIPHKHLQIWKKNLPNSMFVNVYGPTEITCNCTYHILRKEDFEKDELPIGTPFKNERVFLLDENENIINESDTPGEICVSGSCLAIDYIGEERTKSFVQNPLNDLFYDPIYRTGDRGRYDNTGLLYYDGRLDFQIKHLGHRIELSEIEKKCDSISGVNRCASIYENEKKRIVLFYEGIASKRDVYDELTVCLPHFMRPSIIYHLKSLPVSNHGKLDRMKLRDMKVEDVEND